MWFLAKNYMVKFKNQNSSTVFEIYSNSTMQITEWSHLSRTYFIYFPSVRIIDFEHVSVFWVVSKTPWVLEFTHTNTSVEWSKNSKQRNSYLEGINNLSLYEKLLHIVSTTDSEWLFFLFTGLLDAYLHFVYICTTIVKNISEYRFSLTRIFPYSGIFYTVKCPLHAPVV